MLSRKTIMVMIICLGVVTSAWLLSRDTPVTLKMPDGISGIVSVSDTKNNSNEEWKKLLTTVDPGTQNLLADLANTDNIPDEATITNHISMDLLSQYLSSKQSDGTVSEEEKNRILANLLSTESYTGIKGPVYIESNLHKIGKNDSATKEKYKYNVTLIMKTRDSQLTGDPVSLMGNIGGPDEKLALENIDSNIRAGRAFISDFLKIEVPSNAVSLHLSLLNTVSQLVTEIEAMRTVESDPVRSLVAISQFSSDLAAFQNNLKQMNDYLSKR